MHMYMYIYIYIPLSLYIYTCMYTYVYTYTYIYIYLVRHGNRQDIFLLWFPSSTSSNVLFVRFVYFMVCSLVLMVSVVAGNIFCCFLPSFFVVIFVCMVSVVAGNDLFYGFRRWIVGGFCRHRRIHNFRMYRAIPRRFVCF